MNKTFLIIVLAAFMTIYACNHESGNRLSFCISEKIESFKSTAEAKAVLSIEVKGETYYWFNTDATYYDGVEYIFDNACNQACYFCGECASPACNEDFPYDKLKWEVVWKP